MIPTRVALSRSVWKLPYTPAIANLREHAETKKPIKTMARSADIIPAWKGCVVGLALAHCWPRHPQPCRSQGSPY